VPRPEQVLACREINDVDARPAPVGEVMTLMGPTHVVIDWPALQPLAEELGDDVVVSILDIYAHELPDRARMLRSTRDLGGTPLRDAAHSLTASSLTIGAHRLGQLCRDIEAAVEREDVDRAKVLTSQALAEIEDVTEALASSPWRLSKRWPADHGSKR
jgi:HPt (histidine-containing phosphotransfer) domain-containing protein